MRHCCEFNVPYHACRFSVALIASQRCCSEFQRLIFVAIPINTSRFVGQLPTTGSFTARVSLRYVLRISLGTLEKVLISRFKTKCAEKAKKRVWTNCENWCDKNCGDSVTKCEKGVHVICSFGNSDFVLDHQNYEINCVYHEKEESISSPIHKIKQSVKAPKL